jgi:hypothetical protein
MSDRKHFRNFREARAMMAEGVIFSFTFGTLFHWDEVMFVGGDLFSVVNGKPAFRLHVS